MLCFRRIGSTVPAATLRRTFFPFLGLRNLFDELDHGYTVGPRVAVKGGQNHVAIEFDVPRFKANELKISTRDDTLTVTGRKATDNAAEQHHLLFGDSPATEFTRSFQIPEGFDLSQLKTELDHGVYTVTIPRTKSSQQAEKINASQKEPSSDASVAAGTVEPTKVESTSNSPALIETLSKMSWPPRVKVDDTAAAVKFSMALPEGLTADNLDLTLRGRVLNVGVNHTQNIEKKDRDGRVVFSQSQSVSYSTPFIVPEGTRSSDVATSFVNGQLVIAVAKQGTAQQAIKVK